MKKRKNKVEISQCMIVKNEEENIERALSWGKGIVSEQIVVDTGSTDRTVELALNAGAQVYHFQWIDDFAVAKNFAISKAGCPWIAMLDADEYFVREDAEKLLEYVQDLEYSKYGRILTGLANLDDDGAIIAAGSHVRVFRNRPGLRYKRRIHEYLDCREERDCELVDASEELYIYHTGYSGKERGKKIGRNLNLILAELKEHPEDDDLMAYLADEYYSSGRFEEAAVVYRRVAANLKPVGGDYSARDSTTFIKFLSMLSENMADCGEELVKVYGQAINHLPREADFDYIMGRYYAGKGDCRKGEYHLARALKLLDKYGNTFKAILLSAHLPETYELLAACCYNNGNLSGCVSYAAVLLRQNPYLMSTLYIMLSAFHKSGQAPEQKNPEGAAEVAMFLGTLYDFNSMKDRLFVLKAAMKADYGNLVKIIRGMFSEPELACVDMAVNK
ncbi:MAG: glycosyltransferase family 2 protein [Clostridium sp.]|nr:glycosyltransferase family 2 protein [Clostridium sp.]